MLEPAQNQMAGLPRLRKSPGPQVGGLGPDAIAGGVKAIACGGARKALEVRDTG
jgi:hypothetical protein